MEEKEPRGCSIAAREEARIGRSQRNSGGRCCSSSGRSIRERNRSGLDQRWPRKHLADEDGLEVSEETLRRWMLAEGLWSRMRRRKAHRKRRERRPHFGDLV